MRTLLTLMRWSITFWARAESGVWKCNSAVGLSDSLLGQAYRYLTRSSVSSLIDGFTGVPWQARGVNSFPFLDAIFRDFRVKERCQLERFSTGFTLWSFNILQTHIDLCFNNKKSVEHSTSQLLPFANIKHIIIIAHLTPKFFLVDFFLTLV